MSSEQKLGLEIMRISTLIRRCSDNTLPLQQVNNITGSNGWILQFLAEHEGDILLHKTAKAFFDKQNLNKLPRVKDLNAEYAALQAQKKELYPEYRRAREEMQQLLRAQKNLERFFADAPSRLDHQQSR